MTHAFKKAFTLVEVNLAIFVMAGGILAMVSLYTLGFRENRQSREDVAGAALAERVMNPLVAALSSRKITWSTWKSFAKSYPSEGWWSYLQETSIGENEKIVRVKGNPTGTAGGVYSQVAGKLGACEFSIPGAPGEQNGMGYALVVSRVGAGGSYSAEGSPVISIAMRAFRADRANTMMSQPLYYTEVHFQGDPNQ